MAKPIHLISRLFFFLGSRFCILTAVSVGHVLARFSSCVLKSPSGKAVDIFYASKKKLIEEWAQYWLIALVQLISDQFASHFECFWIIFSRLFFGQSVLISLDFKWLMWTSRKFDVYLLCLLHQFDEMELGLHA